MLAPALLASFDVIQSCDTFKRIEIRKNDVHIQMYPKNMSQMLVIEHIHEPPLRPVEPAQCLSQSRGSLCFIGQTWKSGSLKGSLIFLLLLEQFY